MVDLIKEVQHSIDHLGAKERRQRRNTFLYLGLPLLLGIALTFWTARQAQILYKQRRELIEKNQELLNLKQETIDQRGELDAVSLQLKRTRDQSDIMRQGLIDLQSRKYSDAIREFDSAIELDPQNPNAYDFKGYALLRQKRVPEAIENLRRSLKIDSKYIWGHYNLALAYWANKDHSMAVEEVERVLEIKPEFRETFKNDPQFKSFRASQTYMNLIWK